MTTSVEKIDDQVTSMASVVERIAMDPSIPIERLERMLEMKERMEDRELEAEQRQAKQEYFAAMADCQSELPVVVKNQKNDHTKSNYADLAVIVETAMPIVHKHGFSISFQTKGYNERNELLLQWTIGHKCGHSESDVAAIPVDSAGSQGKVNKTPTQAYGSTSSYGRRYLTCMLFNISTGDDNDGNTPTETVSGEQITKPEEALTGMDVHRFLAFMQVEQIRDIPANRFQAAMTAIRQERANNA